ncbi:3-oxoacyl-[acyl-carrier protein] reductase [Faunimonas pinastri]|uniref:3-oxoacyl-[acyl-carrier protein] reductase n=1 Tax=Faunimonas pinastri TaxID=1855383 RepID=A0A1H9FCN1_9HYPH|nr:SDR family oxidoreductase [Faunimonas pinastri]SEQ35679.1 3-oxoacyl-[acyl-carrier protein] reductase [Faunimonas pinastri]
MDLGITGRTAVVCASSRGLGRGCAIALAEAGCRVVINGRDAERLGETAKAIRDQTGAEIIPVAADVSAAEGRQAILDRAGEVDILVNNNGGPPSRDFRELDRGAIVAGVTQNMITPIEFLQAVIDGMTARGFGRVVNITSSSVLAPIPGLDLSSGARAGLTAFLAGVSRQVAGQGVTINNILPGKMDTDRLRGTFKFQADKAGLSVEEFAGKQMAQIPAGRFGSAEEFGKLCAFLCSAHAGYITGQNFLVDGGLLQRAF